MARKAVVTLSVVALLLLVFHSVVGQYANNTIICKFEKADPLHAALA